MAFFPPLPPMPEKSASPARRAAWLLLEQLYQGMDAEVPLPVLLQRHTERQQLNGRDAALCAELVYGVLRLEGRLRRLLTPYVRKPSSLPPGLMLLLLMGSFEILFLNIPARATVDEAVGMARQRFGAKMGGLVNAVLRNVSRELPDLRALDRAFLELALAEPTAKNLAALGSLPLWLAEQWLAQYGPEVSWELARQSTAQPWSSWRINLLHPQQANLDALLAGLPVERRTPNALVLAADNEDVNKSTLEPLNALEEQGMLTRQGMGSIAFAHRVAQLLHEERLHTSGLWDACCGRGGKTCVLLEQGISVSLASDPAMSRLHALQRAVERLSLPEPRLLQGTMEEVLQGRATALTPQGVEVPPLGISPCFSSILLDVPCSGTGTLARNPELRLRLTPQRVEELILLQQMLLQQAWQALQPKGVLFYGTCAMNRRENEEQVTTFLQHTSPATQMDQHTFQAVLPGQDTLFLAVIRKA